MVPSILHLRYSEIRVVDADGRVVREKRVVTSARPTDGGVRGLGSSCGCCLETGTESEWVAQALEQAGHEVVVADPNYAPMYGEVAAAGEDRSAGRGGAGRGESAGLVSADASPVGRRSGVVQQILRSATAAGARCGRARFR